MMEIDHKKSLHTSTSSTIDVSRRDHQAAEQLVEKKHDDTGSIQNPMAQDCVGGNGSLGGATSERHRHPPSSDVGARAPETRELRWSYHS